MSVRIDAHGLHLSGGDEAATPIEAADATAPELDHIHARLVIEIDGRPLPSVGFWGPHDVCLDTWLGELRAIRSALVGDARHVFDECEQGQPEFVFEREGATVYVSIERSEIGEGPSDPAWQRVPCDAAAFLHAIDVFFEALRTRLDGSAYGRRWWSAMHAER